MVGFKTIFLLLSLLIFGACVPQTKQTECGSNEAFNASLRTCVPVMNGPSSFINIDSYSPTTTLSKYKNDTTPITLSIVVDNPYAQTYSITWERIFNGVPVTLTPTTATTYSFAPTLLATEIGTHIISVKIKDAANTVVDSHSFEIKINDLPKPVINSATVSPALYHSQYTPLTVPQDFSFTVKNNGATMTGAGYKTEWKLYRSGALIDSETDSFPTVSPAGSLSSNGFNYPVYTFDPILIDGIAVGSYVLLARVTNNSAEVVAEQQWSMTVAHPALSKITNRDIYSSTTSPTFTAITTAFNGVGYTSATTYNFVPAGGVAQGDYCVSVVSGEGTYVGDLKYVRVDYYLDGATLIYSGLTSAVDSKVCLSDASVATLNSVVFSNSTSTTAQSHTLVARVVDEATGQQYTSSDMNASLETYPVTWNFNVKPQNAAPTVAFGTLTGLTCTTTTGAVKSGCTVASDTNFTVRINLSSDDFYTLPANEANFDYSLVLYRNGVPYQTCNKSDAGYTAATDVNGADGYECVFNIESYDGSGPINLNAQTYQIKAEISDNGSPITGTAMTSSSLTWNFAAAGVTETNTAPTLANWSVSGAVTEGSNINFSVDITDPQRDNHTYAIKYCPDVGCATPTTLTSGTITRTTNVNPYVLSVSYTLPEDFLLNLTGLGCDAVKRNQTCSVNFFITVTDVPHTAAPGSVTSSTAASVITNFNPAPAVDILQSTPAPTTFSASTTFAYVGLPISISNTPSLLIDDDSAAVAEKTFRYQWFVKNNTSVTTYTAIDGATSYNLVWTPSLIKETNLATDNPLSFILCVEDHPAAAVSSPNTTDSICNTATPWVVKVVNNVAVAHDISDAPSSTELASAAGNAGNEMAVWYENPSSLNTVTSSAAYIAMIGNDKKIHIKKVLVRSLGSIDPINDELIVTFDALPTGTIHTVKNLSITGTADELYVAYLASNTGTPYSLYPQVRRIDLRDDNRLKVAPNNHASKFGFDYDGLGFTNACSDTNECDATTGSGVTTVTFNQTGGGITGQFILNLPNPAPYDTFTFYFGTANTTDTLCDACDNSTVASQLATLINTSTDPRLAGYAALATGGQVEIFGARANDYFDASAAGNARLADQLGKIYVSGGRWHLPFIDSSIGGSYNDKISIYSGSVGVNMGPDVEALSDASTTAGLNSMDQATRFDSHFDGTNLWIAMISQSAGSKGKLYKLDPTAYSLTTSNSALFSSAALLDIQVASGTNVYVLATMAVGPDLKLGVYTNNAILTSAADEFDIDDAAHVEASTSTDDYFNYAALKKFRLAAYGSEARLFGVSVGTPAADAKLYVARLRSVSSTWTLSCGYCRPISELGENVSEHVSLGVSPIMDTGLTPFQLGSNGAGVGEGTKDVAVVAFGRPDSAVPGSCDPAIGVFNVEGEAINSTTIYTGTTPNEDAGLYRPALIKN